jgi:peptidoglycan/xylan/chitin deacetylase (PgdA/CDA1 family)
MRAVGHACDDPGVIARPLAAVAGLAGAAWCAPALAPLLPGVADGLRTARTLPSTDRSVALTFDDGPHPRGTPAVLEILREHAAVATFFVVGEQVRRAPALLDEIRAAGHTVAIHGDRHRCQLRLTPAMVRDDLARAAATVGDHAPLHRPPYGIYSPAGLLAARARGWAPTLWSRWGHDWRHDVTPGDIAAEVTADLSAGDILLLHDADDYSSPGSYRRTVAALPLVLEAIRGRELRTVPMIG